jgi:dihydropteroate synthase
MSQIPAFLTIKKTIQCNGCLMDVSTPKVMGILNITPDSFFDGGKYQDPKVIESRVDVMLNEGVDIIDIGAYSSRPGAKDVSEADELKRLFTALKIIRNSYPEIVISVDTFRSNVAKKVVNEFKVDIINDISAGDLDPQMFSTIAELNVPYIMMHIKGVPQNMQLNPQYQTDVVIEVIDVLASKMKVLKSMGVHDVIVDPGFGFGKTIDHNYNLLSRLQEFEVLGVPVLVGVSRKSMIYKILDVSPQEALNGTIALNMVALEKGASFLRVHDVKAAKETITLYNKLKRV